MLALGVFNLVHVINVYRRLYCNSVSWLACTLNCEAGYAFISDPAILMMISTLPGPEVVTCQGCEGLRYGQSWKLEYHHPQHSQYLQNDGLRVPKPSKLCYLTSFEPNSPRIRCLWASGVSAGTSGGRLEAGFRRPLGGPLSVEARYSYVR